MNTRLFLIPFIMALNGCSYSPESNGISNLGGRLCTAAGMNVIQAPSIQAEVVRRGLLNADELQEALQHRVHIGSSQCQVDVAFGNVTGAWKFDYDKEKRLMGKHFIFDCKQSPVPYCPYTSIDMAEGKVTSIHQVEQRN